ncbi:hypothetical protein Vadar_018740 [Vaccinium darrowii]|uniref:Uncharacterized protein n=1 Tax=Vaccinium darrowii TaxID=229202 RepID=A0ACB7Y0X7_9ERIC|nr:hypothetical protein Vadar_018740 [Vaccinium darrowii]
MEATGGSSDEAYAFLNGIEIVSMPAGLYHTQVGDAGTQLCIIHRDVKTSNILLDKDWVAKISNFGLCKVGTTSHSHTYVSTDVKGTFGYLDPEYFSTYRLTKKSDVYAFGVVLLEVLCGRPAVDIRLEEEQRSLALWAQHCIEEEKFDQLIDPSLRDQISHECLKVFTEVANKCLHKHPSGRPIIIDVVASLECMLASQKQPMNACIDDGEEEEDVNDDKNGQQHGVLPQEEDANVDKNTQHDNDVLPQEDNVNVDKNIHQNDVLPRGTIASPSPPVQFKENTQRPKRSKKNLFQRGISFLARGIDISSMGIPDVDIRTTAINELISQELQNATRNFNCDALWGKGRFGQVYRGRLDDKVTSNNGSGFVVAVKKLDYQMDDRFRYWQSEVGFLGRLSHSNLVKLLGYSWDDEELLLVFEFMPKGSLENHLFGRGSAVQPLPWDIRLKILIGAARGLAFLHSLKRPVICREFSASNILLDGSFNSKISDFRYALLDSPESFYPYEYLPTWLCYEPYIAPEYIATGHLNVKSDVYSFGVVLLEMRTGLCARDTKQLHWQRNLVDWVKPYLVDRRKLATVMDSGLEGEYPPKAAWRLAHLARQCLGYDPRRRPSMEQVVETLERINLLRRSNTR